ncbi:Putative disease resistance protein RGA1 [Dendrobium catenatum]|uniref:Disease resistance protein RGA1 n=1 Tax=Dendrobium catenatum TaxID=906689 RepID=A0A2I0VGZ4_9ASPA|nr:Putative disease resistance protein RGA1 [Dendrobium catenatum]
MLRVKPRARVAFGGSARAVSFPADVAFFGVAGSSSPGRQRPARLLLCRWLEIRMLAGEGRSVAHGKNAMAFAVIVKLEFLGVVDVTARPSDFKGTVEMNFSALHRSSTIAMADMILDPIMEKLISAGFRYLKDQVRWQTGMKEELERLQENLPKIQAVVHFASSQEQITYQNPGLNKWLWQLRDAIDDADDVLDELEYMELEKQVTKDKKLRRVRSIMKSMKKKLVKIGKRALRIDPNLKRLEEALQKLYGVSTGVASFLYLVNDAKKEHQKQQLELHGARETGALPKNDLIGRGKDKELVMEWLRNSSNEQRGTDLYRNISLLSIVGHGGMGKTTLLQHVYNDEITKEFGRKMWLMIRAMSWTIHIGQPKFRAMFWTIVLCFELIIRNDREIFLDDQANLESSRPLF